eukprot:TRINITY_DN2092_c0_g1_i3.p1 TRINITY_DN2092_c0_g1~~TRINITY_DN2092_c0_g1_i3.p1  ORF type:complete len:530 (+),score=98.29 TRINITY_DN2092_c0_g1_i3:48-1637(+)
MSLFGAFGLRRMPLPLPLRLLRPRDSLCPPYTTTSRRQQLSNAVERSKHVFSTKTLTAYKNISDITSEKKEIRPIDVVKSLLPSRVSKKWTIALRELIPLAEFTANNKILVHRNGDEAYEHMWDAIRHAQHRVWMETYIFDEDRVGARMVEELRAAAARGCEIVLMYDYWGSKHMRDSYFQKLREVGGIALPFNPMWPFWKKPGPFLFRNHRKVLLVDDRVAFCGGMNVSEEYAGTKYGIGKFRDIVVEIQGPCLLDFQDMIISSVRETDIDLSEKLALKYKRQDQAVWQHHVNLIPDRQLIADLSSSPTTDDANPTTPFHEKSRSDFISGVFVQVLQSNVRRQKRQIQQSLTTVMKHCAKNIYICTPYFIPTSSMMLSIVRAARRGVDVRILTAGSTDVPMSRMAAQHIYSRFLRAGIKVYEMESPILHAKMVMIDGIYSSVGSFNIDLLSQWYNLELNVTMFSRDTAKTLEKQFLGDLKGSVRQVTFSTLNERSIFSRFIHWLAYKGTRLIYLVGGFPPIKRIMPAK